MPKVFHRTSAAAWRAIRREGFRDASGTYMTSSEHTGVWVSDRPLDENEGAGGDVLLSLEVPDLSALAPYEWVEESKGYREWLVPAAVLNSYGTPRVEEHRPSPPAWARGD